MRKMAAAAATTPKTEPETVEAAPVNGEGLTVEVGVWPAAQDEARVVAE